MKNILIILLVLIGVSAQAQLPTNTFRSRIFTGNTEAQWLILDSPMVNFVGSSLFNARYAGTQFVKIGGGDTAFYFGAGGNLWFRSLLDRDTISLSNRINLKLNISDTASMLSTYLRKVDTTGKWITSIYRKTASDSVFYIKGGVSVFAFRDSIGAGGSGLTSVGLSMPAAFTVTNSPLTVNGTISVSGAGLSTEYIKGNGTLGTTDTGMIPNFYLKVRSLLSGTSPISYNSTTGAISIPNADIAGTKGAATFNSAHFVDNGSGLISLTAPVSAGSCTNCNITFTSDGRASAYTNGTGGGGSIDTAINVGSGSGLFKSRSTDTLNFKSLTSGYAISLINNTNDVQVKVDSATLSTYYLRRKDSTLYATQYDLSLKQSFLFLNVKDFGATGDGVTDDAAAIQATFDYVKNNPTNPYKIVFPAGNYLVGSTIQLPQRINGTTESPRLGIEGYGAKIFTTAAIAIFERMPATQAIALDSLISNWICSIRGLTFQGDNTTGQCGLRLGAIYSWVVEDCTFRTLDTALIYRFSLQGAINNCRFQSCKTENIVLLFGESWGGSDANSASNSNMIQNCRVFGFNGAKSHVRTEAANAVIIKNFISEGFNPQYNFILDSRGSTTVTFCDIEDIHLESTGGTYPNNTRFKIRAGGVFSIKNIYDQYPDTLFNSVNTAGSSTIYFDRIAYTGALPTVAFNTGTGSTTLGYNLLFRDPQDGDFFKSKLFNSASWANGVVPLEIALYYQKGSGTGGLGLVAGGSLNFESNMNLSGRVLWPIDDFYPIGGVPGLNNSRPTASYVGTTGMFVDNSARYNFGSATATPDVYMERNGTSILRIGKSLKTIDSVMIGVTRVGTTSDSALVIDATTRAVKTVAQSSLGITTLYTGDGTLAGNRTVTGGSNSLTFTGITNYRINANALILDQSTPAAPYTIGVLGAGKVLEFGYTPTPTVYDKGAGIIIDTNNNVGVGGATPTTAPLYTSGNSFFTNGFQSSRGNFYRVDSVSTNTTVNNQEYFFVINASGGNITMTLPAASTVFGSGMGVQYVFKRIDNSGNTVTVQVNGSTADLIDGASSFTILGQYTSKEVQCASVSNWYVK